MSSCDEWYATSAGCDSDAWRSVVDARSELLS